MKSIEVERSTGSRYSQLLFILLAFFLLSPFVEGSHSRFRLISLIFLSIVLFSLKTIDLKKAAFAICLWLAGLIFILEIAYGFFDQQHLRNTLSIITFAFYIFFLTLSIVLIARRMFSTTKVSMDTILGGISLYLLIGYLWTVLFHLIYHFDKSAFYAGHSWRNLYITYFSFTTLTTTGYGDVYPVNKFAMALANLEAITGQMYLTIFVARMVGLHITHQHAKDFRCPLGK